jgi:hypothetical protein
MNGQFGAPVSNRQFSISVLLPQRLGSNSRETGSTTACEHIKNPMRQRREVPAAGVQRSQRVLVHGARRAPSVKRCGRLAGLEPWGTARGEQAALIRELDATPIDYQREDFTRVLPGGFDGFDGIGEEGSHPEWLALLLDQEASYRRDRASWRLRCLLSRWSARRHCNCPHH